MLLEGIVLLGKGCPVRGSTIVTPRSPSLPARSSAWGANWSGQCSLASTVVNVVGLAGGEEPSLLLVTHSLPTPKLLNPLRTPSTFSFLIQIGRASCRGRV